MISRRSSQHRCGYEVQCFTSRCLGKHTGWQQNDMTEIGKRKEMEKKNTNSSNGAFERDDSPHSMIS